MIMSSELIHARRPAEQPKEGCGFGRKEPAQSDQHTPGRSWASLRRVLVRLRRLLAPEPAALFRLLSRPPTWISSKDLRDLRQSAEELSVAVADAAALAERIRLIQEEMVALINEQTNRTLFVLTVVTVLALPLTIIPGFFLMNIGGIPFREHDAGFWIVVVLLAVFVSLGGISGLPSPPQFLTPFTNALHRSGKGTAPRPNVR